MITRTSLTNPNYLERVKAAVARAVVKAHRPTAQRGMGFELVYNRRDMPSMGVVARRGGGIEFFADNDLDTDVTAIVLGALRDYHANKQKGYV